MTEQCAQNCAPSRRAIVAAHALGSPSLALCYAVQFETALRQWDAAGQWYPLAGPAICPVVDGSSKWAGLEWRHIGQDLLLARPAVRDLPSKTRGSTSAEILIDLSLCPMGLDEVVQMPPEARSALIVNEHTGLPDTDMQFRRALRQVRAAAGRPRGLWSRDVRAPAITEGRRGGPSTTTRRRSPGTSTAGSRLRSTTGSAWRPGGASPPRASIGAAAPSPPERSGSVPRKDLGTRGASSCVAYGKRTAC